MECEDDINSYEELRRRNIQRNKNVMQSLGLCLTRGGAAEEVKAPRSFTKRSCLRNIGISPRRSARIAGNVKTAFTSKDLSFTKSTATSSLFRRAGGKEKKQARDWDFKEETTLKFKKGRASMMQKEEYETMDEDFCSSDSCGSQYPLEVNGNGDDGELNPRTGEGSTIPHEDSLTMASLFSPESLKTMTQAAFGSKLQELVIHALMQSTGSLLSPSPTVQSPIEFQQPVGVVTSNGECSNPSAWNEAAYNRATAQHKRKPAMTRTSAGEESDSQEEFPIPQNESPQERSVRTRRLNRSRARKAKDLTNNRKAMKMLPYVLYIDGTCRPKGIHKHLWRAAVRGQCGRLDPTMDNINHHPKHVVDSIWHALEKEWEFEGFAHRAREMFERQATKFMRNRKMQLKTKCKKNGDERKPNDVNGVFWKKIVHLTKHSSKRSIFTESMRSTSEGKHGIPQVQQELNELPLQLQGSETLTQSRSSNGHERESDTLVHQEVNVEAKIESLRSELLRLEKSVKLRNVSTEETEKRRSEAKNIVVPDKDVEKDVYGMKENIMPHTVNGDISSQVNSGKSKGTGDHLVDRNASILQAGSKVIGERGGDNITGTEVECGDLISLLSDSGGRTEEIGKAIVMALAGSKFLRKVIPKGWHLVKVYKCTEEGALEVCPFPAGWADQVKHKTVKDAEGRNILWPDSLMSI